MLKLPVHSHHRASLVHHLSRDLPSTTAAKILHTTASYVRQCKRKSYDDSDLVQEKYPHGVKRQKLHEGRVVEVIDFLQGACPTKSGSRHVTYNQYISDDGLYQGYCSSTQHPVCLNTFHKLKGFLRVRKKKKYLGMFDCRDCYHRTQLPSLIQQAQQSQQPYSTIVKLQLELDRCNKHYELSFHNAVSIPFSGLSSNRVNFFY